MPAVSAVRHAAATIRARRCGAAMRGVSAARTAGLRRTLRPMPYDALTEEHREIRDVVRELARERIAPRAAEIDEKHEFPWDVVELFRDHELFGLLYDDQYGGTGTGTLLALVAIEEVSKVCATSGLLLAVQVTGSLGIQLAGSDAPKYRWL